MNIDCLDDLIVETDCLDTMNLEMNARLVAGADFDRGANTNPYPKQSAAWCFYEAEYQGHEAELQSLTDGEVTP